MKRIHRLTIYLTLILISNYLILRYSFNQDSNGLISLLGFLILIISIFRFAIIFSGLFTQIDVGYSVINVEKKFKNKTVQRHIGITLITLLVIIAIDVGFQLTWFEFSKDVLSREGVITKAVVKKREWVVASRDPSTGYYVDYEFDANNKTYSFSKQCDKFQIGDTLIIRYLPKNPNQHEIINMKE